MVDHLKTGSCLCGAVAYTVSGPLRPVVACHCSQCRKTSGHYVAATQCAAADIRIEGETLTWFASSPAAERGFCSRCGSNLFWRRFDGETISVWAGSLDGETGLKLVAQIHAESKGDYYDLPDVEIIEQETLSRRFGPSHRPPP
jgi:hypothetical protein